MPKRSESDPFQGRRGRRGPRQFHYTYQAIASVAGLKKATVQRKAQGPAREFDPADLRSVVVWLSRQIAYRQGG